MNGFIHNFATHNAYTVKLYLLFNTKIQCNKFEFQRLQGMGEPFISLSQKILTIKFLAAFMPPVGPYREL